MAGVTSAFATPLSLKLVDGNGATLSGATIIAQSEGSKPVSATAQPDGTYSLDIAGSKISLVIQHPALDTKQTIEFVLPALRQGQTTVSIALRFDGQSFTTAMSDNTKAVAAPPSAAPSTLSSLLPSKKARAVGGPSKITPSSIQLPPTPPAPAGAGCGILTMTQNTDPNTVVALASVSCNAGGVNTDNFYARSFDLSVGPTAGAAWTVGCVDFGVELNVLPYTVTVNIYEDTNGGAPDVPVGDLVLLGSMPLAIADGTALAVVTADFTAQGIVLPADSTVVFEVFTPDRQVTDGGQFFVGSNSAGQSGPTFLKAADCAIAAYVDTAAIGVPTMHWVMRVDLNTTGPIFGACCDDATAVCNDNVAIANCAGRFAANTLCANLTPPCGVILGACCLGDGTCSQTEQANCGGNWLGANTSCASCPITNDDCAGAAAIVGTGTFAFDNTTATTDGLPDPLCLDFSTDQIDNDVWFCWSDPACAGSDVTITTVGLTAVDTRIAVYDGCTCPPTLILACNDDDPNDGLQSTVTFPAAAGPYLIRIGTFPGSAGGVGQFNISCAAPPPPVGPPNDLCADAICVAVGTPFNGNSDNATGTNLSSCAGTGDTADVWHIYTPDLTGPVTVSLCGTAFDTSLSIFDACGGAELACNDDSCGLQSELTLASVTAGTPIWIRIAGFGGQTGDYTLTVTGGAGTCGTCPAGGNGDECSAPIVVNEGTFVGTTADNTGTTLDDTSCAFGDEIDEWYCYTATCTGNATANTCDPATAFDTSLAVFDACGGVEIACNDDTCGLQSEITWSVTAGVSYFVRVSGFGGQTGAYTLNITCAAAPPPAGNDACAGAEAIAGAGLFSFDNSAATTDGVPDALCLSFGTDQIDNDVWFCWTSQCAAPVETVRVETCGLTAIDTRIAVYDGCTCPTGTGILACNDDSCSGTLQSSVTFTAISGQTYLIRIGTFPGVAGGTGQFLITCLGPPVPTPCTEPAANCQAGDLSNAATSTDGAFIVADDFSCPGPGTINSICWWGTYASGVPGADSFTVTYYDDVGGLPGLVIGGPFTGGGLTVIGPADTGSLIAGAVPEFEYLGTHDPVPVIGACYWVSVSNGIVGDTWFWELGFGNGRGVQDGTPPDGFDAGDIILGAISDMKFCLDIALGDPNDCLPPPAGNDACADAEAIAGEGTFPFDNSAATTDGDPDLLCDAFGSQQVDNDVWFCWTAPCSGDVRLETCGLTAVDTKIAVYDGCTCPTGSGILACNDDDCGLQSGLLFTAVSGQSYLIRVGTFPGAAGGVGSFNIACVQVATNDLCDDAIGPLALPSTTAGTTAFATVDAGFPSPCGTSITAPGVWYTVIGTGNTITATTCNAATAFDTKLSIFCRGCGAAICVDGNDDNCAAFTFRSTVSWCSQASVEYLILVHGFGSASGAFELDLSDSGTTCSGAVQCIVEPTGACCAADGSCTVQTASGCAASGGAYLGDGTDCGSEVTVGSITSAPAVAIPDNNPAGVSDTIVMGMSFSIQDVNISLDITHTWVGDLIVTVEHLGTTVTIVDQPGVPTSTFGCAEDNYNIELDDEGTGGAIEDQCAPGLSSPPNYTPNNLLSAFDDMDSAGAWVITVSDNAGGDLGTLNAWTVTFSQEGVNPCGLIGACCVGTTCTVETDTNCSALGGAFQGDGTDCGGVVVVASPSSSPAVAIPDNNPAGVSDTITMGMSFPISDVDITLGVTHTWVGDLIVTVEHLGTSVTIVDQPGVPTSTFGCAEDNYNIELDDEGTGGAIEDQCAPGLSSPPNYTPNNPLSAFDDMDSAGAWVITVSDNAGGDTGTLDSWSIIFSEPGVNPCEEVCTPADCAPGSIALVDNQTGIFSGWCVTSPHPDNVMDIFVDTVDLAAGLVVIQITKSFNNPPDPTTGLVPPILLNFVQVCDDADTVDMIVITEEAVNNQTGVEWTDYHWTLFTTPVAWFDVAASSGFNLSPFTNGVFSNFLDSPTNNQAKDLDAFGGGIVSSPGAYFPGFGTGGLKIGIDLSGEPQVSFTLKQRPSVAPITGACCLDFGSQEVTDLRRGAQGGADICIDSFRPLTTPGGLPASFVMTARTSVSTTATTDPDAAGDPGSVFIEAKGAGVKTATCGGSKGISGGGGDQDEELIFTLDVPHGAACVTIGLADLDFGSGPGDKDDPIIFVDTTDAPGFDVTIQEPEIAIAFVPSGSKRGTVRLGDIPALAGASVRAFKVREIKGHTFVESLSLLTQPNCQVLDEQECAAQGGVFKGGGSDCDDPDVTCAPPTGACCLENGSSGDDCQGKVIEMIFRYVGDDCTATTNDQGGRATCSGDPAGAEPIQVTLADPGDATVSPATETISLGDTVTITASGNNLRANTAFDIQQGGATLQALNIHTSCSKPLNVGDQFGSLLLIELTTTGSGTTTSGTSCEILTEEACSAMGGSYLGDDAPCDAGVCDPTGACCDDATGACVVTAEADCGAGNTYQGDGTDCDPNPCIQPATGACCSTDGTCQVLTEADCGLSPGAVYQGDGTDCAGCFACGIPPLTNDLCLDAIPVAVPSQTDGTTIGATPDGVPFCGTGETAPSVWYSVIGTGNTITVTTCNECTDFDTKLGVFCAGCDNLNCVDGNDDDCTAFSFRSTVSWCSEAGVEYLILVHGFSSNEGNFRLDISDDGVACTTAPDCAPPPMCMADFTETAPGTFMSDTTGAGDDCDLRSSEDHIYEITLPNAGVWTFSLCGSAFDTVLHLGTTCCSADIAINDDSCGLQSEITADLPAGTVWLTIEAFGGASTGAYTLDISKAPSCVPDFTVTAPGIFMGDTTASGDECPLNAGDEHVYEVTLPNDGTWTFSLCGSAYDTFIDVGTTCCGSEVGSNDDSCGLQSSVTAVLTAGTYFVAVEGFSSNTGAYTLEISKEVVSCADFVVTAPGTFMGDTTASGDECDLNAGDEHLYEVTLPNDGTWTFSLCGSAYDTFIDVGTTCCGTEVGSNDDDCGLQSSVTAVLTAGTYFVSVEGFGSATGAYTLEISKEVASCADFVVTAPGTFMGDTTASGDECDLNAGDEHLYEVTLPNDGTWTFSLCGSAYDTFIDVGTTCCGSEVGSNDDSCGLQSSVTAVLTAGTYFVAVEGFSSATGAYTLDISKGPDCMPDFVVTAPGTFMGDTTGAADDCDVFFSDGADHVYEVTLPNDGIWTFALCGSTFDTKIEVGTSCCGFDVGTNDDSCGLQSSVTATLAAGTYFVTVDGFGGATGAYTLDISKTLALTAPTIELATLIDIKPGTAPNLFAVEANGVLEIAIFGRKDLGVATIDVSSLRLSRLDGTGGLVAPYESAAGPSTSLLEIGKADGFVDLLMNFDTSAIADVLKLGDLPEGASVVLMVTGSRTDGTTAFKAFDLIAMAPLPKGQTILTVQSNVAGVWIDAVGLDVNGDLGGFAEFLRCYDEPTDVATFTAPARVDGNRTFRRWVLDGVRQPLRLHTIQVSLDSNHTLKAIFVRPTRTSPGNELGQLQPGRIGGG